MSTFLELLNKTTVGDIAAANPPVFVDVSCNVEQALQCFQDASILVAPVRDESTESGICGFLDILQIVSKLVQACEGHVNNIPRNAANFSKTSIKTILDEKYGSGIHLKKESDTAAGLLEIFAKGVHLVGVTNDQGKVVNVCTQTDMMHFIQKNKESIPKLKDTIQTLKLVKEWVLFVRKSEHAIDAFRKMSENTVRAVAVTDVTGKLISNISASDLRGLNESNFDRITKSIHQFLQVHRGAIGSLVTVTMDGTLEEVVDMCVGSLVHRIWVIDPSNHHPIGIISLTDVCKALVA